MDLPFLKKYQPKRYDEFVLDQEYIDLLRALIDMDNLNIPIAITHVTNCFVYSIFF